MPDEQPPYALTGAVPKAPPSMTIDPDMSPFRLGDNAIYLDMLNHQFPQRILVAQRRQPSTFVPTVEDIAAGVNVDNLYDVIVSATVIRKGRPLTGFAYGHVEFRPGEALDSFVVLPLLKELADDAIHNLDRLIDVMTAKAEPV